MSSLLHVSSSAKNYRAIVIFLNYANIIIGTEGMCIFREFKSNRLAQFSKRFREDFTIGE